jgi:hypothetical protein
MPILAQVGRNFSRIFGMQSYAGGTAREPGESYSDVIIRLAQADLDATIAMFKTKS